MNDKIRSEERRLHGTWAHLTLDSLIETAVRARPDRRSFSDAPDIAEWSDLTAKNTSIGQLGGLVQNFARQILTLGLSSGDSVLIAMPNCVDGIVALLGTMAAGFVACPAPVVADAAELQLAAETVNAKAIVTVNRYAGHAPSFAAREAASRYYGVRFVCAFGQRAPEGVVSLDNWGAHELSSQALPVNSAFAPALVTLDRSGDVLTAHVRTHAQIISDALALSAISGLTGRGSIIATFAPVSAAGFISTVASPLISGTTVCLHGPFNADVLRQQLQAMPEAITVLPAPVEIAIRRAVGDVLKDTIVVTRDLAMARPNNTPGRVTELISLGEVALWAILRDATRARPRLPRNYTHPVGTALPRTMPQLEISLSPRGRLALSGFGVARERNLSGAVLDHVPLETRWLAHGDGPEHFIAIPEDSDVSSEGRSFAIQAA